MSDKSRKDLLDQVKATANQLSEAKAIHDIEPLDIEFKSKYINGEVELTNIILTITTGGPKIELDLGNHKIKGYWGGESVDYPIFEKETDKYNMIDRLYDNYQQLYNVSI